MFTPVFTPHTPTPLPAAHSRTQPCITSRPAMVAPASHPRLPEQLLTPIARALTAWLTLHSPTHSVNTLFTPPILTRQLLVCIDTPAWPSHGPPCMTERDSAQHSANGDLLYLVQRSHAAVDSMCCLPVVHTASASCKRPSPSTPSSSPCTHTWCT